MHTRSTVLASTLAAAALGALCLPGVPPLATPTLATSSGEPKTSEKPEPRIDCPKTPERASAIGTEIQSKIPEPALHTDCADIERLLQSGSRKDYGTALDEVLSSIDQLGAASQQAADYQGKIGKMLCNAAHHQIRQSLVSGEAFDALYLLKELEAVGAMQWWCSDPQILSDFQKLTLEVANRCGLGAAEMRSSMAAAEFTANVKSAAGQNFDREFAWSDLVSVQGPTPQVDHLKISAALDSDSINEARAGQQALLSGAAYYAALCARSPEQALSGTLALLKSAKEFELPFAGDLERQATSMIRNVLAEAPSNNTAARKQRIQFQLSSLGLNNDEALSSLLR